MSRASASSVASEGRSRWGARPRPSIGWPFKRRSSDPSRAARLRVRPSAIAAIPAFARCRGRACVRRMYGRARGRRLRRRRLRSRPRCPRRRAARAGPVRNAVGRRGGLQFTCDAPARCSSASGPGAPSRDASRTASSITPPRLRRRSRTTRLRPARAAARSSSGHRATRCARSPVDRSSAVRSSRCDPPRHSAMRPRACCASGSGS